jgi:hypothetical protein
MAASRKRKADNIIEDTLKQIHTEVHPSIYAQSIANKFFNGQQSTDSSHALLLDMVHHIVTEPPSDDVLRKYLMFLMGWEDYPYGSPLSLESTDPRYEQYRDDLLMLYNQESAIPATIRENGSLRLSNSTVMQIIQDIMAKRCPHAQGCTRKNPKHIALMHPKKGGKRSVKRTYKSHRALRKRTRKSFLSGTRRG